MLLIYISAGAVPFKYIGAESLCKFKFLSLCVRVFVCVTDPQCHRGLRRVSTVARLLELRVRFALGSRLCL